MPIQLGAPLSHCLSAMETAEHAFWDDFMAEARRVIDQLEAEGKRSPFTPPLSLRKKYERAIREFEGRRYCQVRQLEYIFSF